MEEIWLPVEENPKYKISNLGNAIGPRGHLLSATKNNTYGHLSINWKVNGKVVQRYVHRLVLAAFVGPCPQGQEVLHKDDDPTNNRLDNLRYGSHAENTINCGNWRFTEDEVKFIRLRQHSRWEYADHFSVTVGAIDSIQARRSYAHL